MTLVGWWPLHEQVGQANDLSGNGNHGTVNGPTQGVSGKGGLTAYYFDGVDDALSTPKTFSNEEPFTISAWSRRTGSEGGSFELVAGMEYGNNTGGGIVYDGDHPGFEVWDGNSQHTIFAPTVGFGEWHHICAAVDGDNTVNLYVDGSLANTASFDWVSRTDRFLIGATTNELSRDFQGDICDVRLYDRQLSPLDVQAIYEQGHGDYATPPTDGVAYYPLDGDATDHWGTNDGTVSGATVTDTAIRGQAYSFDGTDDAINFGNGLTGGGVWSWAVWVKFDGKNYSEYKSILRNNGGISNVQQRTDNAVQWYVSNGTSSVSPLLLSAGEYVTGQWYHLAGTYGGGEITLYVNGEIAETATLSGTLASNTNTMYIGRAEDGAERFAGDVDDLRLYDRVLSPTEIHQLYLWGTRGRDLRKYTVNQ